MTCKIGFKGVSKVLLWLANKSENRTMLTENLVQMQFKNQDR